MELISYTSYRKYLADYYAEKKSLRSGFSYRSFAQRCGIKSPNYLQLVIQGQRNLSLEMAAQVGKAMQLTADERRLFCSLVKKDHAQDEITREQAHREWLVALKRLVTKVIPQEQVEILSSWYFLLVRELVFLPDFEPTGLWVSQRLQALITPSQAEDALLRLQRAGFLKQDESGRWRASDPVIDTGPEGFNELKVLKFHQDTLKVWSQNLNRLNSKEREMGLINIPIAKKKIPWLKEKMRQFQEEIIGSLQEETNPEEIIQLGVYLLPVTARPQDPSKT